LILVDYIGNIFRHVCPNLGDAYLDLVGCLHKQVSTVDDLRLKVDSLEHALTVSGSELAEVKTQLQLLDTRASELTVVNSQLKEAIAAYKQKRDRYKQELFDKDAAIASLRIDTAEYDARLAKCLADVSVVDALNRVKLDKLQASNLRFRQLMSLREKSFKRRAAFLEREVSIIRKKWVRWAGRSAVIGQRCGCRASIHYFVKNNIDLEWVTSTAERASAGFQRELRETADSMRRQIQSVRVERDDAMADCGLYIDRLLCAGEELRKANHYNAVLLGELSVAKMELSKRCGVDRSMIRAQMFACMDVDTNVVCPVPTVDGDLLPLSEVFRGWLTSGEDYESGLHAQFNHPQSGEICFV
jgi:hypothetical protein